MADVQNVVTLGIGSAPGDIRYFVLMGLDINPGVPGVLAVITANIESNLSPTANALGNPGPTLNMDANPSPAANLESA